MDATPPAGTFLDRNSHKPLLVQAIEYANMKVFANVTSKSMASTVVACHFDSDDLIIGHVGDSRAYLIRHEAITRLTDDHSYVAELLRMGKISEEEAENHPQRNIITRAIGPTDEVKVSHNTLNLEIGDIILMCSDGLTSMIDDQTIYSICTDTLPLDQMTHQLIAAANEAGGRDNITVILLRVDQN